MFYFLLEVYRSVVFIVDIERKLPQGFHKPSQDLCKDLVLFIKICEGTQNSTLQRPQLEKIFAICADMNFKPKYHSMV